VSLRADLPTEFPNRRPKMSPTSDPSPGSPSSIPSDSDPARRRRELLSSLADGRAESADEACRVWADSSEARATWHTYHLIGDVLRSDDLARAPAADADFLARLRQRMADEPVVLAPEPPRAEPPRGAGPLRWTVPVAVAAGFVAVAAVLLVTRSGTPAEGPGTELAAARPSAGVPAPGVSVVALPARPASAQPPSLVVDGQLLRDARLDEYLRAHREMLGSPAASPGGGLRNVDTIVPQR
jgi:sigma-E factor negative regulatory protein RseA